MFRNVGNYIERLGTVQSFTTSEDIEVRNIPRLEKFSRAWRVQSENAILNFPKETAVVETLRNILWRVTECLG